MAHLPKDGNTSNSRQRLFLIGGLVFVLSFLSLGAGIQAGMLRGFDVGLFTIVNSAHNGVFDAVMVSFSLYGREVVWGGLGVGLFLLGGKVEKKAAIALGFTFLVLTGVGYVAKDYYSIPRPYDTLTDVRLIVEEESDGSFPSGHTMIVVAGVVIAWIYLRRTWAAILSIEAGLVAYSRMYVGVHYPSDILGGVLLGIGCALFVCSQEKIVDKIYEALPEAVQAK